MTETTAKNARVLVPVLVGSLVTVALGVYGAKHQSHPIVLGINGFENLARTKSVMATIAGFFALVQLVSALIMWGKIRVFGHPSWISGLHRWSGRLAFFTAVPVGVFCLYGIGFQDYDTRVLAHSLLGCLFFGVFTIKMLVLTKRGLAGWVLPVFGGLVFTLLVAVVATSALWFFTN